VKIGPDGPKRPGTRQLYGERACQGAHPCQTVRKRRAELPHSGAGMWPGFPPPLTINQNGPCGLAVASSRPTTTRPPHHSATAALCTSRRTCPHTKAPAAAASWQARCPTPPEAPSTNNLSPEKQPALAQRVQRGQSSNRQGGSLGIADRLGQGRHRVAATIHLLGSRTRGQNADDASARSGSAAIGGGRSDDPGKIPAGSSARFSNLQGAPRLAAV
jgi:hypothetical protein